MLSKRFSNLIQIFTISLLSFVSISCGDGDGPEPVNDTATTQEEAYTLVWSDEFDVNGAPNVKNWRFEEGYGDNGWGNNEWQQYTDDAENLRVEDGNLVIAAQCSNATTNPALCNSAVRDGTITSARINTKDKLEVKYGNIQARIKVPAGKGTWPAFWMLGANFPEQSWPGAGEVDIMEIHQFYSDIKTTHTTVHWCDESVIESETCIYDPVTDSLPGWTFDEQFKKFDTALSDDFHVFEVDWDEDRIVGKIDGNAYFSKPIDPANMEEFLSKFFMILNVGVGGTLGGPPNDSTEWPQEMLVDWVRVYQRNQPDVVELVPDEPASPFTYENFVRIVNSVEFGGDSVVSTIQRTVSEDDEKFNDITPPAVTPLTGNTIVEFDYESANTFFSGAAFLFKQKDITHYEKIVFSLDTTMFPNLDDIAIEMNDNRFTGDGAPGKISIPLSTYTPVAASGNWKSYEIPLTAFVGVNLDNVASWGFWNPKDASGQLIAGKLYLDDIRLVSVPCTDAGFVSFSTDTIPGNSGFTQISVTDACLANKNETVVVVVDNGTEAIGVSVPILASGLGIGTVNFGLTKDATSTIAVQEGDVLTATYKDANGADQTDTANIFTSPLGLYSETHVVNVLEYSAIINDDTVTVEASAAVSPLEGDVSLQAAYSAVDAENGFAFNVAPVTSTALLNASFESPDASGGRVACDFSPPNNGTIITDWECINFPFVYNYTDTSESSPLPHAGDQTIAAIGLDAIVQQSISVDPGATIKASAYAMNWTGKPLTGIAIMLLNFFDAADNIIQGSEVLGSADGSQAVTLAAKAGNNLSDWTRMEITAVAPAGAVTAQILLLHVIGGGTSASAVYWDDASLAPISTSDEPNDISYFSTLKFGLNSSAATGLMDVEIRMTDGSAGSASVFLSNLTPTAGAVAGWEVYEIPLSVFAGLDLTDVSTLGFYNASTDTVGGPLYPSLFNTTLYFDDVHFALDDAAVQTGVLVNSPIEGATFSTATQSGITNALGEFQYLQGEMVTFSIGDIDLGTVVGAPVVTPVELTGSANPTNQAAINQLVFLQSIDAGMTPSNGITISAFTQAEAVGKTLDFTLDSAAFTTAISGPTGLVNIIAPGNAVVSETDAVNNFYQTFPPTGSATNTIIDAVPGTVDANGTDTITITVQAKDSSGNNITVSAGPVTLLSTGNAVISSPVLDNGNGTYSADVTNSTAEEVIITGTIDGNLITDNETVIFLGAVSLADTTIDAAPTTVEANGAAISTITVQAKDINGNPFVSSVGTVALTAKDADGITDNLNADISVAQYVGSGKYTATVRNAVTEVVIIKGTIAGGDISDDTTVIFGPSVGVYSETHAGTTLQLTESAYSQTGCNANTVDDAVPDGSYPSYEGAVSAQVDWVSAPGDCNGVVFNFGRPGTALPADGVTNYSQDFEGLASAVSGTDPDALGNDGWSVFAAVTFATFPPAPYTYGPFTAPNGGAGFSAVALGDGQNGATDQYINIYSDYDNGDHGTAGSSLETSVFQERTIRTEDMASGNLFTFSFDYRAPPTGGIAEPASNATASAFIVTLDPNAGFARTNDIRIDMTNADPVNWGSTSLELLLSDPALVGQILQFGFSTVATGYEDSGVYYDNLSFSNLPADISGNATLKFALDSSLAITPALADLEIKMEDTIGGAASVYLSGYMPVSSNNNWDVYEIPLSDFTATLDKTIVKTLGFYNASSTVSAPPAGAVNLFNATLYIDDIHFIEQP